jgi:hypothetical protein
MVFYYDSVNILFSFSYFVISILLYKWIGSYKKVLINKDGLYISDIWKEIYIPFSAIKSVTNPANIATQQITINLFNASPFGKRIRFAPKFFQAHKIAKKLKSLSPGISTK